MGSTFTTLQLAIKNQDLFGVPVQLSYKGQTAFNTVCGGCLSVLIMMTFSVYFAVEIRQLYLHPEYLSTPYTLSFGSRTINVPTSEGLIAVGLTSITNSTELSQTTTNKMARVTFNKEVGGYVPGVYCTDLFSQEIAAEQGLPSEE